jgi:hypothetical protein
MFAAGYIGESRNGQILPCKSQFWPEEEMRFACQSQIFAVLSVLIAFAPLAWADDPVDEKNWLKESTWPTFVAEHRLKIADSDDALTKLLKERYNEGQHELRDRYVFWLQSEGSLPQVYDAARRVIEARLEAGEPGVDKVSVLKEKLAFAKLVEKQAERIARKSTAQAADNSCARYFRANTELELMRAEKEAKRDIEK